MMMIKVVISVQTCPIYSHPVPHQPLFPPPFLFQARPKIAEYPFTTLHPHVGVCHFRDSFSLTVADIPGLIEGAHLDRGLGHEFLRHIERTKCLAYVVDVSAGNKDPAGDLKALVNELVLYDPLLAAKPAIVIANKMDAKGAIEGVKKLRAASALPVIEVSAKDKLGVGHAVDAMRFVLEAKQRQEEKAVKIAAQEREATASANSLVSRSMTKRRML